jgi:hypothetical protein
VKKLTERFSARGAWANDFVLRGTGKTRLGDSSRFTMAVSSCNAYNEVDSE